MATRLTRRDEERVVRRATNISLDGELVDLARELGVNISRACEAGLAKTVSAERNRRWQEENREATEAYNDYIEKHGLPLERYRLF